MLRLAEVVRDLREELWEAVQAGAGQPMQFGLGDIELELSITLTKEGGTGGKVRFWVVEVGADGKVSSTAMQTVKLTLSPQVAATGQRPFIGGDGVPGEGTGSSRPEHSG